MKKTSLVIIGGGPGGYETALYAKNNGIDCILIEKDNLGGVCLNRGCIATKTLVHASQEYYNLKSLKEYGISVNDVSFDLATLIDKKDKVIASLRNGIESMLELAGVELIVGKASLVDNNHVKVNDELIEAKNIIIATGSKHIEYDFGTKTLTSKSLLESKDITDSLIVIGGGVVGIECACIYACLGLQVNVIEAGEDILVNNNKDAVTLLKRYLKKLGVKLITNTKVTSITKNDSYEVSLSSGNVISAKHVLQCAGRKANLESLNLDDIGIKYDKKGIIVNDKLETNINGIYAIGDINGILLLESTAVAQGKYVIDNLLGNKSSYDLDMIPRIIYAYPSLAEVGKSLTYLDKENIHYTIKKAFYMSNGYANAQNKKDGAVIMAISDSNEILNCAIIGAEAEELIHIVQMMMVSKISYSKLSSLTMAHPTLSELVLQALK